MYGDVRRVAAAWRHNHSRDALTARVGRPFVSAVGMAQHAVKARVLGMSGLQDDATLTQARQYGRRELRELAREGIAARHQVRQLDRLLQRQLPGQHSHHRLGVVLENRRAAWGAEGSDEVVIMVE